MNCNTWTLIDMPGSEDASPTVEAIRTLIASHPAATLDHDPVWLEAKARAYDATTRLYVCWDENGALLGYAPFYVHRSAFAFAYGGYTLWNYPLRRYSITATPLLQPQVTAPGAAVLALVGRLHRDLVGRDVLFLLGLHMDTPIGTQLASASGVPRFLRMAHGPAYQRRRAEVKNTLDGYLATLGSKTRQDLRRQERRLLKEANNNVRLTVYSEPQSVGDFLAAVERVSRQTYQWNQLGIGIASNETTAELLRASASNGWLRGYVLHAEDQPIAFMVGHLYRGTYLSDSIGYDPAWNKLSAGNVLHLYVMADLAELADKVKWFDFMYGDNSNKERLSNDAHLEQNYYLIPNSLRWRVLVSSLNAFNSMTNGVSELLDRFGLKDKIRRTLRQRSTQSTKREDTAS